MTNRIATPSPRLMVFIVGGAQKQKRPTVGVTTLPPPAQPPIKAAGEESRKARCDRQALSATIMEIDFRRLPRALKVRCLRP
jgi:hypothetical protein